MANNALVSPNEPRESGYRVAQVESETFEVGAPLFWTPCDDNVVADEFWYDPTDKLIKANPIVVEQVSTQPTITDLQAQLATLQAQIAQLTKT
jgi:hypothetical protein